MIRLLARLVAKDLTRRIRSPLGLCIVLAFPVLFAGMLALAFGGSGETVPKVRLLIADEDDGLLGRAVAGAFGSAQLAALYDTRAVDAAEGRAILADGGASALLVIPEGFTRGVLDETPVALTLVRNPAEGILPEIAEQTVGMLADVLDGGRRVFDRPIDDLRPYFDDGAQAPSDAEVVATSLAVKRALERNADLLWPPAITLESELFGTREATPGETPSSHSMIFLLVLPGVAVYAIFLVGDQAMRDVMTERTLGTLRRQLAGPVSVGTFVVGKALYTAVLSFAALLVLAAVGAVVLREPVSVPGFLAVSAALVLAITGTSAAIYGFARTERQASTLSSIVYLFMAFVGGSFFRIEGLPPAVRAMAPFTPFYWATQGYRDLLERGEGLAAVLPEAGVLALIGAVLLAVGGAALHRAAARGAAA